MAVTQFAHLAVQEAHAWLGRRRTVNCRRPVRPARHGGYASVEGQEA